MSMEKNLNKFLEELIQEVEKDLDEATASANVAGYNVPGAFSNGGTKDKKRKKKISTQFGMKIVGKMDEDLNEGYGSFIKAKNLTDIVALSKKKKNATFYVTDDNNSRIGTFYLKNGKFAKATSANPNYDFQSNKTKLKDRSDVIYKYKVDESVNEGPIDRIFGGIPYTKKGKQSIVNMKLSDDVKKRIIQRAKKEGKSAKPNNGGGVTVFESVNEVGKGSNWAEKYVNDTNLYKKLNWYIKMGKGAEKKIKGKEFVIMSDGSALIWNTKTSDWELYKPKRIDKKTGKPTYESVNEASFRPNSGTMSGGTYNLDKRKYELKRDVKGVKIGDYTNVTLPKGTIIYNLPGGVFAHHRSLKSYEAGMNKYFNQSTFRGISIRREKNVILSIEKNSKILESVNEGNIKLSSSAKKFWNTSSKKLFGFSGSNPYDNVPPSQWNTHPEIIDGYGKNAGADIFKKFIRDKMNGNGYLDSKVAKMTGLPTNVSIIDYLNDGGSGLNGNKNFKRFNNWSGALYDIYEEMEKKFGKVKVESVNEAKVKRPVNRWLELKNDETMHPHKKMAMGLKELKYQLRETQKFFNWYGKIKSMNELDSSDYWKRTNKHIYNIKERLINIARTIQEIEK